MLTGAVIPWGDKVEIFGRTIELQIADINIGILYVFGVVSLGVYGIMIGAWASNNKYSLMGGLRAASQIISYELAMGLSLIALLMITGTLSMREMVDQQVMGKWNIFYQPLGFMIFLICAFAECNRTPFDLAEAENELIGGYHAEYSSMKLGFYLFAEYINMFISSAVMASLYFGGYDIPFVDEKSWGLSTNMLALIGGAVLMAKIIFFLFFFMWVRWTIPRFRYDQLMNLGWKSLIPLALMNMLVAGLTILSQPYFFTLIDSYFSQDLVKNSSNGYNWNTFLKDIYFPALSLTIIISILFVFFSLKRILTTKSLNK
jgi:NADH-quinone oxidoreductase subunit H